VAQKAAKTCTLTSSSNQKPLQNKQDRRSIEMRRNHTPFMISTILALVCLAGCYVAGNYPPDYYPHGTPPDTTAVPDSNKVITVNGKRYKCLKEDGSWKCVGIENALATARKDLSDPRYLDASHR
jgi:hypothetical protein